MKHEIGVNTNCNCGEDFKDTLENIKAAGFRNIMFSAKSGDTVQYLGIAKKMGIEVPFVHLAYRPPYGPSVNNIWIADKCDAAVRYYIDQMRICDEYGVRVAVMHTANAIQGFGPDINAKTGIESVRQILKATKGLNIKLAFENQSPPFDEYLRLIFENIKDVRLGFCYDSGHHHLYSPEFDWLDKYGGRCFAVHLQDNLMDAKRDMDWDRDIHLLPGDGKINFEEVMRKLRTSNYQEIVMLELNRKPDDDNSYINITPIDFLKEAYKRGQKLAKLLDDIK